MWFILPRFDTGLYPPNMITLSSEILVKEKSLHGGGGLPVTVGVDQHPADKQHSLLYTSSHTNTTVNVPLMYDNTVNAIPSLAR